MNDHESEFDHHAHPVGPEIDDSVNPTQANPQDASTEPLSEGADPGTSGDTASDGGGSAAGDDSGQRPRPTAGREMLIQLQQMIDTVALQAAPVVREVAAKAAELAAVAAERAGPVAHRAAEVTESVGERIAARSKEVAADLRRPQGADQQFEETDQPGSYDEPGGFAEPGEPGAPSSGPGESTEQF